MDQEIANLRDELQAVKEAEAQLREIAEIRGQLAAVYSSTTWRATALVRRHLASRPYMATYVRRTAKLLWWTASGQLVSKLRKRRASLRQLHASVGVELPDSALAANGPAAVESPDSAPVANGLAVAEYWSEALPMVSVILSEAYPEDIPPVLLSQLNKSVPRHELVIIARDLDQLPTFDHPSLRCYLRPADVGDDADGDFVLKRIFGKYVCFLRPTDQLSSDYVLRAIEQLELTGAEYAVCHTSTALADPMHDEFPLPPVFRRSTLQRLGGASSFGSRDTRLSRFAATMASADFASAAPAAS